jgi:hypothetical protein
MANTLLTKDVITLQALDIFENELAAAKCCSRDVQDDFGNKGGQISDSIRIRKPAQFSIRSGQTWVGEDIEEQFDTLTLEYGRFVVTADVSDTAGGAMTISISPEIVGPGERFQNVSELPGDDAAITMFSSTARTYSEGIVFNEQAVALAIVPLDEPGGTNESSMKYDKQSGVGLRYIEWYDGDKDLWKSRFDVLYGILLQRPEWACVIASG